MNSPNEPHIRRPAERGQTLLMFVLFMLVLFLFVGLGIDIGFAYITKANLSKAVDAACLTGMRNLSLGTVTASAMADSTFHANYGTPGRDVGTITPSITFGFDPNNNRTLDVSATATINTFFIRVLPSWKTLQVSADAQSTRSKLIMSLVLDRSGSMNDNGGASALPGAVIGFVNNFDDVNDRVSMSSFSYAASTDVALAQPFKAPITTAVNNLVFNGWTASQQGLTNGLVQNLSYSPAVSAGTTESVVRVMIFFTDGLANTFLYTFNCGARNIAPDRSLYDPNTGAAASGGCTIPSSIPSVSPPPATVSTTSGCSPLTIEAQKRALAVARLAQQQGVIVFSIGLGDGSGPTECGFPPLNQAFLYQVANDPNPANPAYDSSLPSGEAVFAPTASELADVFNQIASKILLRLTR